MFIFKYVLLIYSLSRVCYLWLVNLQVSKVLSSRELLWWLWKFYVRWEIRRRRVLSPLCPQGGTTPAHNITSSEIPPCSERKHSLVHMKHVGSRQPQYKVSSLCPSHWQWPVAWSPTTGAGRPHHCLDSDWTSRAASLRHLVTRRCVSCLLRHNERPGGRLLLCSGRRR